jgi:hypothetical protein
MKTPREILLARHEKIQPELELIRNRVLRMALTADPAAAPERSDAELGTRAGWLSQLWQQLCWQPRRTWLGLACAWGFITLMNLSLLDATPQPASQASAAVSTLTAWQEHQRCLESLILLTDAVAPEREPVPAALQPRSQGRRERLNSMDQAEIPPSCASVIRRG